jgi:hypothetical protein
MQGIIMTKHIHAELMRQYAQDAMETDKPWKRWECNVIDEAGEVIGAWIATIACPLWDSVNLVYRRKPKTIRIGNYDVPEPLRVAPEKGTLVFTPDFHTDKGILPIYYGDNKRTHSSLLTRGMLHLTKEAAELHAKAVLSFTTTEINDD